MREPRVFTAQALHLGSRVTLAPRCSRYLIQVLRLRRGDPLRVFGDGRDYRARLLGAERGEAVVLLEVLLHEEPPTPLDLHLILGISKGERMDFAVQKAVELGVTRLTPLLAQRSVVQLVGERLSRRLGHWEQVMIGACEQSGRCRLPRLDNPLSLDAALSQAAGDLRLVLYHRGGTTLGGVAPPTQGVVLLIGPEGGLEEGEIHLAEGAGFLPLRLGPRVLRTETAPLAAIAAIQALWGDFCAG
jgi:16S rRNA (uracil1498-N3)-methyltransferase